MHDLTVTLVQADQIWEDVQANLKHYTALLSTVEATDLIILPEMFQTAFSMNTSLAETMDGKSIVWLKAMSAQKNCAIYTSLMTEEGDTYFNRGIFVFPTGEYEIYDKRKTFGLAKENEHFASGQNERIVHWRGWNIQLQICYDLRFPEIVRNRIDSTNSAAYDLIVYVANWPEKRSTHWKALLKARAIENQSYVIGVNRVGVDANGFNYSGDSQAIDALGNVMSEYSPTERVDTFVINKNELTKIREILPFLSDR